MCPATMASQPLKVHHHGLMCYWVMLRLLTSWQIQTNWLSRTNKFLLKRQPSSHTNENSLYLRELYSPLPPCDQPEAWLWYPEDQTLSSVPRPSEWPSMLLQMPATMRKEAQWWEMFLLPMLPSIVREVLGKSRKHICEVVCMVFRSCLWCNG